MCGLFLNHCKANRSDGFRNRSNTCNIYLLYYPVAVLRQDGGYSRIFNIFSISTRGTPTLNALLHANEVFDNLPKVNNIFRCGEGAGLAIWDSQLSLIAPPCSLHGEFHKYTQKLTSGCDPSMHTASLHQLALGAQPSDDSPSQWNC